MPISQSRSLDFRDRPALSIGVGRQGEVTYWLTQVLTGHGCFGQYLCRIGRECTTPCHHCEGVCNTAQHTLAECSAWSEQPGIEGIVGGELSLSVLVTCMVGSEEGRRHLLRRSNAAKGVSGEHHQEATEAEAAVAIADSDEMEGSEEVDNGGGAITPLSSPVPVQRSKKIGAYAREIPSPYWGDEIKGEIHNNVGITPQKYLLPYPPRAYQQTGRRGVGQGVIPSLSSRRQFGAG